MRRQVNASIGNGRNHGDKLNRRNADLLADGDGADGRGAPFVHRLEQAAGFSGHLGAGSASKAEVMNVLGETALANLEGQLDGGHVTGSGQRLGDGDFSRGALALVVVNDAAGKSNLASLAIDDVVGRDGVLLQRR